MKQLHNVRQNLKTYEKVNDFFIKNMPKAKQHAKIKQKLLQIKHKNLPFNLSASSEGGGTPEVNANGNSCTYNTQER